MGQRRSVILDAELREHASGQSGCIPLTGGRKLNDFHCEKIAHSIPRFAGEIKQAASSRAASALNIDRILCFSLAVR
jgi:hypothetical protein